MGVDQLPGMPVFSGLYINKKQKFFSKKQKGFRDGLSHSTPQKSEETRGNAITHAASVPSHP